MSYHLNFITVTADQWRRKRIRQIVIFLYLFLWTSTGIVFYKIYNSVEYMADILNNKVSVVENEIINIEPNIILLQHKISQRNILKDKARLYNQVEQRPLIWYATIREIQKLIPNEIVLDHIRYTRNEKEKPGLEANLTIAGHLLIDQREKDLYVVDKLRSDLANNRLINALFSNIYLKNNIYREEDHLKMIFSVVMNNE